MWWYPDNLGIWGFLGLAAAAIAAWFLVIVAIGVVMRHMSARAEQAARRRTAIAREGQRDEPGDTAAPRPREPAARS